jgi:nicotinamide-nucleotide amidase
LADHLTGFEDQLPPELKLAYLPAFNSIRLRLTGKGEDKANIQTLVNGNFKELLRICGEFVVTDSDSLMASAVAQLLIKSGKTISLAESCTGGFIANQLILEPGISSVMKGAMITYSNEIKHQELGVPEAIFTTVGAVSEECARAMVEGVRKKFDTDVAISTTGIAGPGGATPEKPVGLIYIGIATRTQTLVKKLNLFGNREVFMQRACTAALDLLRKEI